jgi:hypothetical protein
MQVIVIDLHAHRDGTITGTSASVAADEQDA